MSNNTNISSQNTLLFTDHPDRPTLQNLQLNNFIGDPYKNQKPPNTFRLHAGNPNGIKVEKFDNDYAEYLRSMALIDADCVAMFEINLDTQKPAIKKTLHETSKIKF